MNYLDKYQNKVAWVTGASSGIGEQLVYQLSALGAKLILSSRNEIRLQEVAENCKQRNPIKVLKMDLNNQESLAGKCSQALDFFGRIDYLFNIAGVAHRDFALDTDMHVDRKIMQINYFSAIEIIKKISSEMITQGSGHIIVTSSLSGKFGVPKLTAYAASKHALHGFIDSFRAEIYKKGIKITVVIPGFINTPIIKNSLTGDGTPYGKNINIQEKGISPYDCAKKILAAVAKEKEEVIVGGKEIFTLVLKRLFPHSFDKLIRNHPVKKLNSLRSYFGGNE